MNIRKVFLWLLCALLLVGLTGCGGKMSSETVNGGDAYMPTMAGKEEIVTDTESQTQLPADRKLIQRVNMQVETEDLDAVLQQINSRVAELSGYVESSNVQNGSAYSGRRYRSANITVRIPAKDLDSFLDKVESITNIVSSQKTVEDVTLTYVATESRLKALETEETRLLELLAKAEDLNDLLTVVKRLTEVRTELEQVASLLRVYDNQVNYATIHLSVEEVKEFTEVEEEPDTVWQRIGKGFVKSLKGVGNFLVEVFVFLVVAIPYLVLTGAILFVIQFLIRLKKRRKAKKES